MFKKAIIVVLSLVLVAAVFAKAPERPTNTLTSQGYTAPNLYNWSTDQVSWTIVGAALQTIGRSGSGVIGNYMYCFGNENGNYGQALNLTTDAWEASTPAPLGYDNWAGLATGSDFYLIGRYDGNLGADVQRFTPTGGGPTGAWAAMAPYPTVICGEAAAWDGGNYIYGAGGLDATFLQTTAAYRYDIANNSWSSIASMPGVMGWCGGAYVNDKFHVMGGTDFATQHYAYDPVANTWATMAPLPQPVYFANTSVTNNGVKIFCVGGGGGYGTWPATNAVQIYDPAANTWAQETVLPNAYGNNAVAHAGNGIVYSAGGYTGSAYSTTTHKGVGFPVPYDPNSPGAVTNYTVSNNGAALMASLAWTNPTVTAGGATLTDLTGMRVYRDGTLLTDLTGVTIGGAMTHNDNTMTAPGMYGYTVVGYNTYGEGIPSSDGLWIGLDVPGGPSNVTATPDPGGALTCTIDWTAPTAGAHGGYWPAVSWTGQRVYRDGSMVADLTGTNTSYTDNVTVQGWYSYGASYYNASGESPVVHATPDPVFIGPPEMQWIPYDWVEINTVGTNTGITGDDQNLGPFPMGFDYPWYDAMTYNSIRVCSNGFLSFTSTSTSWSNAPIPSTGAPNDLVAPWWEDLYPPGGGSIWYHYDATNRRFIMEFDHVAPFSGTGTATFEAIFYPTGIIDFMYMDLGWTGSATVGIENGAGTVGIQCTYNGSGPLEPTNQSGIRIFPPFYTPPTDLEVTVYPYHTPVEVYPGGLFWYIGGLNNYSASPITFDLWSEVILPGGTRYGPLLQINNLTLPGGASLERAVRVNIPYNAPPGEYQYYAAVGDYPGTVIDDDQFPFTILNVPPVSSNNEWSAEMSESNIVPVPSEFVLGSASPNPFNPSTTLSFSLPEMAKVQLVVYDVSGREVATLINGMMEAGAHETQFNAGDLSSGIYFYRLTAGDFTSVKKMVLVK